ncbi:hypothetical protein GF357_05125 [Candidatus Dojkabacteria bacterium]|nr:hypothetical protein [Candidatus Dojkabacteria bacterium]
MEEDTRKNFHIVYDKINDIRERVAVNETKTAELLADIVDMRSDVRDIKECIGAIKKELAVNTTKIILIVSGGTMLISATISILIKILI